MKYKNILIHLDHSSGCRNRLEAAFGLARKFDAQVTGLFVVPNYVVPSYVEAQISVDLITDVTEKAMARAGETLADYQNLAKDAGVDMQGHVIEGQLIPILREHSKYSDLLVLGQDHPEDPDNASYGLADSPFGPLAVILGFPLDPTSEDKSPVFEFSVGGRGL